MLRGWGASAGTRAWNARLDPAVAWLSPLPHSTPLPGTRCSGELGARRFQEEEGEEGAKSEEKRWVGGKGAGR